MQIKMMRSGGDRYVREEEIYTILNRFKDLILSQRKTRIDSDKKKKMDCIKREDAVLRFVDKYNEIREKINIIERADM